MRRLNLFTAISKILRIVELCVALIVLSWTLTHFPLALRASAEYLHKLSAFAATPLFVFAVSNAIIAALLAQRSSTAAADNADLTNTPAEGIYQELLSSSSTDGGVPPCAAATEVEYEDKKVISQKVRGLEGGVDRGLPQYRQSRSKKLEGKGGKTVVLRRSETEKKVGENGGEDYLYPQDELSSEEFQRTIEAFIAKQMRILREESSAIVAQNTS